MKDLPINFQQKIIKSWDKVLDLDFEAPYWTYPKSNKSIQATFWTLKVEEIVKVVYFIAR